MYSIHHIDNEPPNTYSLEIKTVIEVVILKLKIETPKIINVNNTPLSLTLFHFKKKNFIYMILYSSLKGTVKFTLPLILAISIFEMTQNLWLKVHE